MKDRQLITEYINLRIQKSKTEKPYWDMFGESVIQLLDAHFQIEKFADRLLGITDIEDDVIQDFISSSLDGTPHLYWDTPDTVEELINGLMEGRFKEDE